MKVRWFAMMLILGFGLAALAACEEEKETAPEIADEELTQTEPSATEEEPEVETAEVTVVKVQQPKPFESFVTWDKDGDKEVTKEEFEQALQEDPVVSDWDGDGDGELTDVEFENAFYKSWDINGDGIVDIDEYKDGSGAYFRSADAFGTFEDYDNDGDKELKMTEFADLSGKVYSDWDGDGDGELTDLEFRTALYNAWDLNGDGVVDHYEYRWD
jgi:Ca2+-binding EF-hand superfamily protein